MLTSHKQRLLTASILLPLLGLVLWQKGLYITIAIFLVAFLALNEFYSFFWSKSENLFLRVIGNLLGLSLILIPIPKLASYFWLFFLISFWVLALIFLFDFGFREKIDFKDIAYVFISLFYIPLALKLFETLNTSEILLILLSAFASDTGAYYAGLLFGKRKIWPKVSPKKTWIGSLGGLIACLGINIIFGFILDKNNLANYFFLGILLNLGAQLGDFFESALKRKLGIKDSSNLLPGHGGILDRIDSLLFILPIYFTFKTLQAFF